MKLVEILARELKEWPRVEGVDATYARQDGDKEICFRWDANDGSVEYDFTLEFPAISSDANVVGGIGCTHVTRAQWEAERARIAMDCISAFSQEQDQAEQAVSQYEQELWDKVAIQAIGRLGNITSLSEAADAVASLADAFMAERAKRLKQ